MARSYADFTINDPSALKRWVQNRRYASALSFVDPSMATILDFGGGNGELCRLIAERHRHADIVCYEPAPRIFKEAMSRLTGVPRVRLINDLAAVADGSVDAVFCLEVFEHLSDRNIGAACERIAAVMRPGALAVIGVPIEIGPPALLKGVFRMLRRYGAHDATLRHVLLAAIGKPPAVRPARSIGPGMDYFFDHLGFDHRRLAGLLREHFTVRRVVSSPFHGLGTWANSEVYFLLNRRDLTGPSADASPNP